MEQINIAAFQIQCERRECVNYPDCSVSIKEIKVLRPFYPKLVFESDKLDMSQMRINCRTFQKGVFR